MAQDSHLVQFAPVLNKLETNVQSDISDTTFVRLMGETAAQINRDSRLDQLIERFVDVKLAQDMGEKERMIYISAKASAMANQGIELSGQGKRAEAIKLLYQALALIQQTQDSAEIAQTLINIGVNHFNLNDWEEAITLWQEAIGYLDSKADSAKLSQLYSFLA
ncbi:MAG: tetratricopeptide repeat protein, partial [Bacteroidetes bacterium]|nr:tetratricopeptide repeat protein [Bacteroidota bacterium]